MLSLFVPTAQLLILGDGGGSESLEGVLFSFICMLEDGMGSPGVTGGCEPPNMVAES